MTSLRPLIRLAWREARRNRLRSALVVAMIAVPIGTLVVANVLIVTTAQTTEQLRMQNLGAADAVLRGVPPTEVDRIVAGLPDGTRAVRQTVTPFQEVTPSESLYGDLVDPPLGDPIFEGYYRLSDGRAPRRAGEAAVHPELAAKADVGIGDELVLDDPEVTLRIVGLVKQPQLLHQLVVAVAPGQLGPDALGRDRPEGTPFESLFVAGGASGEAALRPVLPKGDSTSFRSEEKTAPPQISVAIGSFGAAAGALLSTGLVASAALAVAARRQQRDLGLLAAAGAAPRRVRQAVVVNGGVLGFLGSLVGVVLAAVVVVALHPHLDRFAPREPGPIQVPAGRVLGAVLLGVVAAAMAAWVPARGTARLPVTDLLAWKRPVTRPAGWLAGVGFVLLGAGLAVMAAGTAAEAANAIIGGGALVVLAAVALSPAIVGLLGAVAGRLPTLWRIAARDIARHRSRSGAAVAAVVLVLAVPVGMATYLQSAEARDEAIRIPQLGEDQLVLSGQPDGPTPTAEEVDRLLTDLDVVERAELRTALVGGNPDLPVFIEWRPQSLDGEPSYAEQSSLLIGDDALLRAAGADSAKAAFEAGKVVALIDELDPPGRVRWAGTVRSFPAVAVPGRGSERMRFLISAAGAQALGFAPAPGFDALLVRLDGRVTDAQHAAVLKRAQPTGTYVERASQVENTAVGRTAALGGAAVVALLVLGIAVALVAVEARRDRAVLQAVGASPGARRRLAAVNAGLLALLAGLVAAVVGFVPVAVVQTVRPEHYPLVVPWAALVGIVVVIPLLAAMGAALLTRTRRQAPVPRFA